MAKTTEERPYLKIKLNFRVFWDMGYFILDT